MIYQEDIISKKSISKSKIKVINLSNEIDDKAKNNQINEKHEKERNEEILSGIINLVIIDILRNNQKKNVQIRLRDKKELKISIPQKIDNDISFKVWHTLLNRKLELIP